MCINITDTIMEEASLDMLSIRLAATIMVQFNIIWKHKTVTAQIFMRFDLAFTQSRHFH